jgi:hypothetical protein
MPDETIETTDQTATDESTVAAPEPVIENPEPEQPAPAAEQTEPALDDRQKAIAKALGLSAPDEEPAETDDQTEPKPTEAAKPDEKPAEATEEAVETTEDQLKEFFESEKPAILSKEEIDQKFNRVSKEARAEMHRYAEMARAQIELTQEIGSPDLLPPAVNTFKALQSAAVDGDYTDYLTSIAVNTGLDGLFGLMDDTLFRVLDETRERPTDPQGQQLFDATLRIVDRQFQQRFGEGYTSDRIANLIQADQAGLVDWDLLDDEYTQPAQTVRVEDSPEYKALETQLKDLQAARTPETPAAAANEPSFEAAAAQEINAYLKPVIGSQIFTPLKNDSAEVKEFKSVLSDVILTKAAANFRQSPEFRELYERFENKTLTIPQFKSQYDAAIRKASLNTGEFTLKAQKLIKSLYKDSVNAEVQERLRDSAGNAEPQGNPTETIKFPDDISEEERVSRRRLLIEQQLGSAQASYNAYRR